MIEVMRFAARNFGLRATSLGVGFSVFAVSATALALEPQKKITQFAHQSWGAADGLDQVYAIAQTADGYIWVGAANGLFQFDGFHFKAWEAKPGEPKLPANPSVLLGAKDGSLWVASLGHMLRLQNGRATDFLLPGAETTSRVVNVIKEARDGTVWVGTSFGLSKFTQGRWQKMELPRNFKMPLVTSLLITRDETVWAAVLDWAKPGSSRILFLRPGETQFRTLFEPIGDILRLSESGDGTIWLCQTVAPVRAIKNDARTPYFIDKEIRIFVGNLVFDREGNLWTSSHDTGLARIDGRTVEGTNNLISPEDVKDRFSRADGLSSDYVNCIFEDREGNLWTGTAGGLDCFRPTKIAALSHREGLPYDSNLSIQATPDGSIWAYSTPDGLEKIDSEGQYTAKGWSGLTPGGLAAGYCLYADKGGDVVAGTAVRLGLVQQEKLSDFPLPKGSELKAVTAITRDAAGGLWLCDHDQGVFRSWDNELQKFPELHRTPTEYAITAHTDSSGRVWLGYAYGGIACYEKGQIHRYTSQEGLFSGQVRTILSDDKGRMWAAGNGGLSQFENERFRTLTRENGLADDDIYAVLEDDNRCLWIAGVHGLFRVALAKLEAVLASSIRTVDGQLFEVSDGVRGIVHHAATAAPGLCYTVASKSRDGKLWFSTSAGLAIVDPKHIFANEIPPVVHIEQIVAAGKTNSDFNHLRFPKGTKDCEIDYVGLSFIDPSRVRYEYKLEGYDKDWVKVDTRRQAFYSNLQPKAYRFRVRACNGDGVWNEAGDAIEFLIAPKLYQAAWFPPLCAGLLGLGFFGLHRLRLARLAARMNLQLVIQQNERKRIAQELHDTLLQGFTGVGLKLDALVSGLPASLHATKEQFQKTLRLIDQYLAEGRRSVWKLRSPALEGTDGLAGALLKASERALEGTGIRLDFSVQGEERKLNNGFEDNLLRICEEAVANAVKHARPTRAEVTLKFSPQDVQLRVRDNGCGFDTRQFERCKDGHFGLVGIQERVDSMGGRLSLNSQPRKGTELAVTVRTN
jgi:signal transduction histidine kinase/sugar lactone lactonase YvrE